jgi:tRNA G18 (ribose-2'-O)-methylase SpoU
MPLIEIDDPADERLTPYRGVADRELLQRLGLFIVEGRLVVRRLLLESRFTAASVLVTGNALASLADVLPGRVPDLPVYIVPQSVMDTVSGFNMHRGCLATGIRAPGVTVDALPVLRSPARLLVLEQVSNPDNIGGIFRCAAALGGDAIVLGRGCGDPLYRKAIRTSIGTTLTVPFVTGAGWPDIFGFLQARGFTSVALTTSPDAHDIGEAAPALGASNAVALLLGNEGHGLSVDGLAGADVHVRISMAPGVDSLNVTVAAGIALHALGTNVAAP